MGLFWVLLALAMPKLAPKWQKRETTADLEQTQLGNAKTLRNGFKRLIDVNDFDSVKDLAVYLKRLSQNLTEYRKYFKWNRLRTNKNQICSNTIFISAIQQMTI